MAIVTGTFTGTGQSSTVVGTAADVSLSGGASATVAVQRRVDGTNWVTIESITGDGERVVENATGMEMRLSCTSYSSGTVKYSMVTR
jgi:hypothetical protein